MTETIAQRLRKIIGEIRRKPYPIKDLIPLLDQAATELETVYEYISSRHRDSNLE